MTILSRLRIDLAPFLLTAGGGGFAIGFGVQSLAKDVISGFFILLESQIFLGDVVDIAGVSGWSRMWDYERSPFVICLAMFTSPLMKPSPL